MKRNRKRIIFIMLGLLLSINPVFAAISNPEAPDKKEEVDKPQEYESVRDCDLVEEMIQCNISGGAETDYDVKGRYSPIYNKRFSYNGDFMKLSPDKVLEFLKLEIYDSQLEEIIPFEGKGTLSHYSKNEYKYELEFPDEEIIVIDFIVDYKEEVNTPVFSQLDHTNFFSQSKYFLYVTALSVVIIFIILRGISSIIYLNDVNEE